MYAHIHFVSAVYRQESAANASRPRDAMVGRRAAGVCGRVHDHQLPYGATGAIRPHARAGTSFHYSLDPYKGMTGDGVCVSICCRTILRTLAASTRGFARRRAWPMRMAGTGHASRPFLSRAPSSWKSEQPNGPTAAAFVFTTVPDGLALVGPRLIKLGLCGMTGTCRTTKRRWHWRPRRKAGRHSPSPTVCAPSDAA